MGKALKFELTRAFYNRNMLLSIVLGVVLASLHFIVEILPKSQHILTMPFPWTVYCESMIFCGTSLFYHIYIFAIMLFAAIPFSVSYYQDIHNGFIKNICLKMKKRDYLLAKYIAVFLSSGVAGTAPAIINIMLTMTALPALKPQGATGTFPVHGSHFLSELYYQIPLLYICIYLLIDFMFCGVLGCMALAFAKILNHRYLVLFTPFIVYFSFHAVFPLMALDKLDLVLVLSPVMSADQTWGIVIGEFLMLFILSFVPFYWKGCSDDVI